MSFIQDYLPIFKKHNLTLVEKNQEPNGVLNCIFKPQEEIQFKPGQHGVFFIKHVKIKKSSRAFSIASTPEEGNILISMRISENPSEFKRALLNMTLGENIIMRGPIGSFYIKDEKPVLFIAGGIGITPYRSLIKDSVENPEKAPKSIKLLYSDSREDFVYQKELNEMKTNERVDIKYITNRDQLTVEVRTVASHYKDEARYYVSGSRTMIKSIKKLLREAGVGEKSIKSDVFIGY